MTKLKIKKPWPTDRVMTQIYDMGFWGENDSKYYSGDGSHQPEFVVPYIHAVSQFLNSFDKKPSVCDLGCGDFNIGKQLLPFLANYIGIDIVPSLVDDLKKSYQQENVLFYCLDIAKNNLPQADIVILRQVLQHLSNEEIQNILNRLYPFKYLLLTEHIPNNTFIPNVDIITGRGIRIKKKSGVSILDSPFHFNVKSALEIVRVPLNKDQEAIVTTLYEL